MADSGLYKLPSLSQLDLRSLDFSPRLGGIIITLSGPFLAISCGWPNSDCNTVLNASPSAEMNTFILSADTRGRQSRAPLILTASARGAEHARMRMDIMTKFLSSVLLNFLLRASVGVVTGMLRTGGMSSRSSRSLSDAGFVRG